METLESIITSVEDFVWGFGIPAQGESIPLVVIALLGTGIFLTIKLGFVQFRRLGHGFAVTSGRYDDPNEPGDVSHFQALTTALSATVGIGNIAGVAIAIHWGGPGALFWMWMTALLGMAVKYSEVTLAQKFRDVETVTDGHKWEGSVSGGPMYYIARGLGSHWKPLGVFFAAMLGTTAFFTGNAAQANTVADTMETTLGLPVWITGIVTASVVAMVIIGGITRIGKVTGILAPAMAAIYVAGALTILVLNANQILPTFVLIFSEAFDPTAGIAGTGVGAVLVTMMWGVKRGLFSNEAGQGSAPIAHAAAKTDEPVSEGVVGLVEPFIDTIIIVTMTALVIIITGVWNDRVPTEITLTGGDLSYVVPDEGKHIKGTPPATIRVENSVVQPTSADEPRLAWHEVPVEEFYTDPELAVPFTGSINPGAGSAVSDDGSTHLVLYAEAYESGAPLTSLAFRQGLGPIGDWGHYIVLISVFLFGISTAISWSYYGDRCATYLFGAGAVLPYKIVFILMHFVGAVMPLAFIWKVGDIFLGIVILPNLLALWLLAPKVREMSDSYFERKPWIQNLEDHRRAVAARKQH